MGTKWQDFGLGGLLGLFEGRLDDAMTYRLRQELYDEMWDQYANYMDTAVAQALRLME